MANPDYPAGHFFKDRMQPAVLDKSSKKSDHEKQLAKAYATVNEREADTCQVSGVKLSPASRDEKRRREHHHLKGRNVKPEWVYDAKRIVLVSAHVHKLLQGKVILVDGTDATKPVVFSWNRRLVKPGKEPMRLEKVI